MKLHISRELNLPRDIVTSTIVVYGGKGMGKRLALDTPLPTPNGWISMGTIRIGDYLFDEQGLPCRVTYVSPIATGDSYRVSFSDGSIIYADAEHLWSTESYRNRRKFTGPEVHTTIEIKNSLFTMQGHQRVHTHSIRNCLPLKLRAIELPIDPYVLGLWLGDGNSASSVLTVGHGDEQAVEELVAAGHPTKKVNQSDAARTPMYYVRELKAPLRNLGLLNNKHVPIIYLRSSGEQRLALLQGLMDSDGGWSENLGNVAGFSNQNEKLSNAVYELVVSLGMKATLIPRPSLLNGEQCGIDYRVRFVPTMKVFRLARKAELCRFDGAQQQRRLRRYITAVEPVESMSMRCIAVDSASSLYLAGTAMVPTHNTNLGDVIVEELTKCHLKWAALDPLGVWYGVRHSRDGKGPGVECVVLGGVHGDMPIEPTGGAVVADLVVDEPGNVVIDFSRKPSGEMWSIGEKIRFITDYTKRVFQRQGGLVSGRRREPFMQILDEAARYIPQVIPHGATNLAECLGAWETLIEEGRNIGIGALLLTQRSARMAKSVSEVADAMFSFRIVGPNSIKAVTDWLGEHVSKERVHQHIEVLRSLERGRCLVVSPGWLQFEGVIHVRARETFDSSATPKPGERATRVTGKAAKPDLDKYLERMKETIQKAEANDPKKLQAKVRELQAQLARATVNKPLPVVKETLTKVKASAGEIRRVLQEEIEPWKKYSQDVRRKLVDTRGILNRIADLSGAVEEFLKDPLPDHPVLHPDFNALKTKVITDGSKHPNLGPPVTHRTETRPHPAQHGQTRTAPNVGRGPGSTWNGETLPEGEKLTLIAIGQHEGGVTRPQLTALTGYMRSTRDAYLSRLKAKDLWQESHGRIVITHAGIQALGDDYNQVPSTGKELQAYWMGKLPTGEKRILELLIAANAEPVDRDTLDQATGFARSSRDAYLSRLGAKELIENIGRGQVKAVDTLFA